MRHGRMSSMKVSMIPNPSHFLQESNILGANGQTPAAQLTGAPPPGSHLNGGQMAHGHLSNQMDRDTAAQVPELAAQIPNEPVAGPYLQFISYNPQQYLWRGSALVLVHESVQGQPSITLTDREGPRQAPVSMNTPPPPLQPPRKRYNAIVSQAGLGFVEAEQYIFHVDLRHWISPPPPPRRGSLHTPFPFITPALCVPLAQTHHLYAHCTGMRGLVILLQSWASLLSMIGVSLTSGLCG